MTVCSLFLLTAATVLARRPVISYIDRHGALRLYDSTRKKDIDPPPVPTFRPIKRFRYGMSLNGRYVVYNDSAGKLHLLDRATDRRVPLPGVDVYAKPGSLTVSDTGLIAFDDSGKGPARVYDSIQGRFVDTGLAADNGHRQTRLSGDGRFLATSCTDRCVRDTGAGPDVFVQDLRTRLDTGFPRGDSPDGEHPCINRDGSLLGLDETAAPGDPRHDVFLFLDGLALPFEARVNTPNEEDRHCTLDSVGVYLAFITGQTKFKLYDRARGKFVALPAGREFDRFSVLTEEYPGDRTAPRVRRFRITHRRFAVGRRATAFKFGLSEPARVRIQIWRNASHVGTIRRRGRTGANTITFDGRLAVARGGHPGRGALRPGRYVAVLRATDQAVNRSRPALVVFHVLRSR